MSLNQLTTNFLEAYKTNNIDSTLFCFQPSHLTMTLDLKDTIIRSLITPQNYINGLLFPILCSSITDFSCIVIFLFFSIYDVCVFFLLCILLLYCTESDVISKLRACTFVTCSLNMIDWYSRLPHTHGNTLVPLPGAELNMTLTRRFTLFKVMCNIVSNPFLHKFIFSTKTTQNY